MTNKMPEVGKEYKEKGTNLVLKITHINNDEIRLLQLGQILYERLVYVNPYYFWEYFEELPSETKESDKYGSYTQYPIGCNPNKVFVGGSIPYAPKNKEHSGEAD